MCGLSKATTRLLSRALVAKPFGFLWFCSVMAKWFEDGVSPGAVCVPRPAAHPSAAGEVTAALSMAVLSIWVEKTSKGPGGVKPICSERQFLNVGFAASATVLSLSPRVRFAGWGLRNVGGHLLSWHIIISMSCAVSAALFVPEYSISVVRFEML